MKTIVDKESKRKNIEDLNTLMNEKEQWVKLEGLVAFAKNNTLESIQSDTYRIQTRLQATLDWIIKVIMSSLKKGKTQEIELQKLATSMKSSLSGQTPKQN